MQQHLHLDLTLPMVITLTDSSYHPPLKDHLFVWSGMKTLHPDAHTLHVVMSIAAIDVYITLASQTGIIKQFIALINLGRHSRSRLINKTELRHGIKKNAVNDSKMYSYSLQLCANNICCICN